MPIDKQFLVQQLAAQLRQSDDVARRASDDAREAARSLQTESEKKEDGRAAIEYGSLATAQTSRSRKVQEDLAQLAAFWNRGVPRFAPTSAVALGALVDVVTDTDSGPLERTFFVLPVGAGAEITGPGGDGFLSVITPSSPVGRALMGKRAGDEFEVTINRETREWRLVEVS